jgi:serine/threonine-protein kinase
MADPSDRTVASGEPATLPGSDDDARLRRLAAPTLAGSEAPAPAPPPKHDPEALVTFADDDDAEGAELGRGASVGRYLVLSLLGRGGMGEVYTAYDPELDRKVALKLLHTARGSIGARRMLAREARALGKLSHPNVVQVYDVGEHGGDVFVAMELVEGEPLDVWVKGTPKPGFREVIAVYLDAARGLSAAHASGLVHRDVKPSNILRGKDGRVRVLDFGLAAGRDAAPSAEEPPAAESEPESIIAAKRPAEERLTRTGALLGTPLYMAPEQHDGPRVTPASDQYSLCVALYEALYGVPPFQVVRSATLPKLLDSLRAQKLAGPPAPPPRTEVPPWVWKAVRRGLSPQPGDRYPTLPDLIAALSDDPDARKRARRRQIAIAAATAIALFGMGLGWSRAAAPVNPCAHPERDLAGVWDQGVKARVRAALSASGRAQAEGAADRVVSILDRYGADWTAMRGEVCEARRAGQARALADLRDLCLERRRGQLRALTSLFAEKDDPAIADKALQAASELYPVATCADADALTARVRPPEDPAVRARVAELQPRVDRVEALFAAGKYQEGLAVGEPLHAEVAAVPYPPLRAQAAYALGRLKGEGTSDYEGSKALLREAIVAASEGRDDLLAAAAWSRLLVLLGDVQQKLDEAAVVRALGPSAIARAQDDRATAAWLSAEGVTLVRMGKPAEAKACHERALALREKALGPDHPDVAASLGNLANALWAMGDYSRAKEIAERALALREKLLGPEHPDVARSVNMLASVLSELGEYARVLSLRERTLSIREKVLGPEHPEVANALNNLGTHLFAMGEYERSRATHERALAIREKTIGPDHPYIAHSLDNLADVLMRSGDSERALAYSLRALAVMEKARGPEHPELVDPLTNVARAELRLGQLDAARAHLDRAVAVVTKAHGPAHPDLADTLIGLGELHLARKEPKEAVPFLERAIAIAKAVSLPEAQLTLADALAKSGADRARARASAEAARASYERAGHRRGVESASRWLAEHPG